MTYHTEKEIPPYFKPLKMYVRNNKNQKIGVLYSFINHNKKVVFGWSLCNKRNIFNSYEGTTIAYERGLCNDRFVEKNIHTILPHTIKKSPELQKFLIRVKKYYKNIQLHPFIEIVIYSHWINYLKRKY